MTYTVEQVAMALISLRDAQHHLMQATRGLESSTNFELMVFDIEKMVGELVIVARTEQRGDSR